MKNRDYRNDIELLPQSVGYERRSEMTNDILENGTYFPKTVVIKDIDEAFKEWVENELVIYSDDNIIFPTMTLYSNQRFSEYSQSWQYTDANKNLILNFKTVFRDNNPQLGKIVNGYWNIPGDRTYLMARKLVQDDNGTQSILDYRMRLPMALDLTYQINIFTTKFDSINKFNVLVNDKFKSRQCYIAPNKHFMPMTLENINDASSYMIDDRQYYGQTYSIKVMAYIIQEKDFVIEEIPLKRGITIGSFTHKKETKKANVEIEDITENKSVITLTFDRGVNNSEFHIDTDFNVRSIETNNIRSNFEIYVNGVEIGNVNRFTMNENDEIVVKIKKVNENKQGNIILHGLIE